MAVSHRGGRRRRWRLRQPGWRRAVGTALLILQSGCYAYVPLAGQEPVPGKRYALELTDRGRADLADRLGPGVESVEGTLLESSDGTYQLSVTSVKTIAAPPSHWGGERVAIPSSAVAHVADRHLDKGRTAVAIGVAVIAVGTFIATRGLFGFGPADSGEKLPPPNPQ